MYQMKAEVKEKYLSEIRKVDYQYQDAFQELNKILRDYGADFYDFSIKKLTDSYYQDRLAGTKEKIKKLFSDTMEAILEHLKQMEKDYNAEMYAGEAVTDQMELYFVEKELEVMDLEELKEFYITNIGDENKRRLFHIELKRRSRSGQEKAEGEARTLEHFVSQFNIGDEVSKKIADHIRFYGSMIQIKDSIIVVDLQQDFSPRFFSIKDILHAVDGRSVFGPPREIDFFELMRISMEQ